jgi:hypothetical protein
MSKPKNNETLPAVTINEATEKELADEEGVLELDDFSIKMNKDAKRGFSVKYADDWEAVEELPPMHLAAVEVYWAQYTGSEYLKRELNDPPPEKEADAWKKHGKLTVHHSQYGQGGFLLAPSGVLAFKAFVQKWRKQGVDVLNKPIKIGYRVAKTKAGYIIVVPKFLPAWIHQVDALPEPTVNHLDQPTEPEGEVPWEEA